MSLKSHTSELFHKLVSDNNGKVIIFQLPNLPVIGWFVALVASQIVPEGFSKSGLMSLSTAFLFLWAYLEITQGASYLRRFAGVVVMLIVLFGFFV